MNDYRSEVDGYMSLKEARPNNHIPCVTSNYPDINNLPRCMAIVSSWLFEVANRYVIHSVTLHIAYALIDRFMNANTEVQVKMGNLQLIGVTCLLIACKCEEIYPPEVSDMRWMCDGAYTSSEVKWNKGMSHSHRLLR